MKYSSHTSHHTVQFHETDMAGFVHYTNLFNWTEKAEFEFMNAIGVDLIQTNTEQIKAWPRVHVEADFFNPLRLGDKIVINLSIVAIGKYSISYTTDIFKQTTQEDILASRIKIKSVYVKMTSNENIPQAELIPNYIRDKIEISTKKPH